MWRFVMLSLVYENAPDSIWNWIERCLSIQELLFGKSTYSLRLRPELKYFWAEEQRRSLNETFNKIAAVSHLWIFLSGVSAGHVDTKIEPEQRQALEPKAEESPVVDSAPVNSQGKEVKMEDSNGAVGLWIKCQRHILVTPIIIV